MLPIEAIWQDFSDPAARALGWGNPVWWGTRKSGDVPQTVLSTASARIDPETRMYGRYRVQISIYDSDRSRAEEHAQAVVDAYAPFTGRSSSVTGLVFANAWRSQFLDVDLHGIIAAIPLSDSSFLWKAVVSITFINLYGVDL
jgi:hypothetical protein